jgi:hypothetical protein
MEISWIASAYWPVGSANQDPHSLRQGCSAVTDCLLCTLDTWSTVFPLLPPRPRNAKAELRGRVDSVGRRRRSLGLWGRTRRTGDLVDRDWLQIGRSHASQRIVSDVILNSYSWKIVAVAVSRLWRLRRDIDTPERYSRPYSALASLTVQGLTDPDCRSALVW